MLWKASVAACVLPLAAACALAQPGGPTVALNDLIRIAVERNRELQAAGQQAAAARAMLRQAAVRPAPSLEFGAASGRPLGSAGESEYSAAYSLPFETGGKRAARIRVAQADALLAETELAHRTLLLTSEVKLRFFEVAAERARLAALSRLSGSATESLQLIAARVQAGDAAPLDSQLQQVELHRLDARKRIVAGRLQAGLTALRRLCGLDALAPLVPADPGPLDTALQFRLHDLQAQAAINRADLRAARLTEQRASAESALAQSQSHPDVTLTALYSLRNESIGGVYGMTAAGLPAPLRDRDNTVGFNLSLPLFSRSRNLGNLDAAAARATASRSLRLHLDQSIPLQVQAAAEQAEAAAESLAILNSQVLPQTEKNLEIMRQAYALGQLRLLDVLNEQRRLIDTRLDSIEAELDLRRALVELEQAVGGELK